MPTFLLSDSSLLFSAAPAARALRERMRAAIHDEDPSAVFIGAASGDPEAAQLFDAAMDVLGIGKRRALGARYSAMDDMCLSAADVIVLGGGDVARGWDYVGSRDVRDALTRRYLEGSLLVGVSAGAILLGRYTPSFEALCLVPVVVDVHDEANEWQRLRASVGRLGDGAVGIGIPFGSAAIYADGTLEPLGKSLVEVRSRAGTVVESLLVPAL